MSRIRADKLVNRVGSGGPKFPNGVADGFSVSGIVTATSFQGDGSALTGVGDPSALKYGSDVKVQATSTGANVTGNVAATGNVTAVDGTFSGNLTVNGTTTTIDTAVTAVDSLAIDGDATVGGALTVTGNITANSFNGDGSQLTGVSAGGESDFVASGNIPNGSTVVINTDGTVGIVTQTTDSVGTAVVFESATTTNIGATFDSNSGKVVIAYMDGGNSNYGTAVVGTVNGTSISFGTPVVFESAATYYINPVFDSSNNKVVIAYMTQGNSSYGTAIVGTVSGTSISFGSSSVFETSNTDNISAAFDSSNNKVVIAYQDSSNSNYGTAVVGTVSGTSISFGSLVVFESGTTFDTSTVFDSSNNKIVISYKDGGDSNKGKAIVGTVSGTSISFGSAVTFESDNTSYCAATYDSTNNKVVIAYQHYDGSSSYMKAIVGTVSGDSISFGSRVALGATGEDLQSSFNSTNGKVVVVYRLSSDAKGYAIVGTVSGTSISFDTHLNYQNNGYIDHNVVTYDSANNKVVISYQHVGNSSYGTASVFSLGGTNLTAENYIGIAAEAISNGATGKVNILGGTNTGQTGLTPAKTYYVQPNGTLATSAGNPSVVAGTAISNTKILVR